ncbi:histidine kinase [Arcticibacter svalbardensis MN12-7]|uniref:Histidine kinase n=1 Tax=Arcticibacter svalbardensis MN12-7 TaxID=1150600 RepID=R9GSY6_9SPHI|nr:two-component regulator propeller domain-containing protein [Arcticibacter svalbardensis]EOR94977.1 histidine kinase [Arcticibacter svalbardensis MN12-7]
MLLSICISSVVAQPYYFKRYEVENGLSSNTVFCFLQDHKGFMWFGTVDGLNRFDGFTFKLFRPNRDVNLVKNNNNPYSIFDNAVNTLSRDKEGGIWVGSFFGGLNYYPKHYNLFEKFFPANGGGSHSGHAIREICKDQYGYIWVGTEDAGLNKFNPKTGISISLKSTGAKTDIAYTNIHGLLAFGIQLWIGTFQHGLDIMDIAILTTGQTLVL